MEDIIRALLDVVRAQHSASENTDEAPFGMNDIVDMAMNIVGRPDESEEAEEMVNSIQRLVETLAPDIFPPKTFEEMDDTERAASVANMIEERLRRGMTGETNTAAQKATMEQEDTETVQESTSDSDTQDYGSQAEDLDMESEVSPMSDSSFDAQHTAELNDLIYKNLMEMMGAQTPQVEYPFDVSQITYGKEKSITEMLEEEKEEERRTQSAWELAQNAIDKDEQAHEKEPYIPQVAEEKPAGKTASQLAAEAIRRSQEEDREKLEIEKQAERLMEEAKKRGQDPMKFALHQQEILRYMEKNSDELVSFEDYEDLSPEEKYEIERQIHIEKQLAEGIRPEDVNEQVPEEFIPEELKETMDKTEAAVHEDQNETETEISNVNEPEESPVQQASTIPPVLTEEMLRQLSQEVIRENSDMILSENANEDMESLNDLIMQNIMHAMQGSGTSVPQEDVDELLAQAAQAASGEGGNKEDAAEEKMPDDNLDKAESLQEKEAVPREEPVKGLSAVELARAAQRAAKPEPVEVKEEKSAVELAREAQEREKAKKVHTQPEERKEEALSEKEQDAADIADITDTMVEEEPLAEEEPIMPELEEEEEFEYVDPDELVLGEHTQAEIDEALDNLNSLGLEGEVYERAKRMLLLEMAGSEGELDAWLREQETGKKKKATVSALDDESLDLDDLEDLDEDILEKELELAMDEDFPEVDETEEEEEQQEEIKQEETQPEEIESEEAQPEERQPENTQSEDTTSSEEDVISEIEVEDTVPVPEKEEKAAVEEKIASVSQSRKKVVKRREKTADSKEEKNQKMQSTWMEEKPVEEKEYQVSLRQPFFLKNSASFMDQFENYIQDTQENRKLSTGFKKLDAMLRYGLHKGTYFIDAEPQYLKNSFMQQMADRAAESGVDVLYISTELSRYDLMVETISRLSYEIHQGDLDKAVSAMDIMTGENGADLTSLKDELNWYRGRISEHLYILDQEAVSQYMDAEEDLSAGKILAELIRSIVRDGAHKPVVFIDNIENILSMEDKENMKPLMEGIRRLAGELAVPILISYGYAQAESETEMSVAERQFHTTLGNMCDVYMELQYADMITEDSVELTTEDIQEMMEEGETLLLNLFLHRNRRPLKASCQIQAVPKFNYYEE